MSEPRRRSCDRVAANSAWGVRYRERGGPGGGLVGLVETEKPQVLTLVMVIVVTITIFS